MRKEGDSYKGSGVSVESNENVLELTVVTVARAGGKENELFNE